MRLTFEFIEWVEWSELPSPRRVVLIQSFENQDRIKRLSEKFCDLHWDICLLQTLDNESQCWLIVFKPSNSDELKLSAILGPILWPPDANSWLIGKDPDAGKDWKLKEKGMAKGKTFGWHHQWTWSWANSRRGWEIGKPRVLQNMGLQSWTQLGNWTTTNPASLTYWSFAI